MSTTTPAPFADTVAAYLAALRAASEYADADLTPEALTRRREELTTAAHRALTGQLDALPDPGDDPRTAALDALRATTADDVAVQGREREKVTTLLASGKSLDRIIAEADAVRVAAILDNLEVMPDVLASDTPGAIIAEVRALAFDRLAEVGDPGAVAAAAAHSEWAATAARRNVLGSIAQGAVSTAALTALYHADPEGYQVAAGVHEVGSLIADAPRIARRTEQLAAA